jgi:peroxiredoxin
MTRLFRTTILPAATAVFLLTSCGGQRSGASAEAAGAKGEPRPAAEFTLEDSQGGKVSLADYKGQVVLLNFWATWCGPCKIEMPWFVEFQRKYKDRGFTVLAVSMDEGGWEVVRPYLEQQQLNFPVVLGDDEMADRFGGVQALPTTFIIDREGRIVATHTGLVGKNEYEKEIDALL